MSKTRVENSKIQELTILLKNYEQAFKQILVRVLVKTVMEREQIKLPVLYQNGKKMQFQDFCTLKKIKIGSKYGQKSLKLS